MTNTAICFEELSSERQPMLAGLDGTLRFDVAHDKNTECWHVTVDDGVVLVSNEPAAAEAVARLELLDSPGRWGAIDPFGRGRIDTRRRDTARQ